MGELQKRAKKKYTEEFQRPAVGRMHGCRNVVALSEELDRGWPTQARFWLEWEVALYKLSWCLGA
jgi:hypothetical protein